MKIIAKIGLDVVDNKDKLCLELETGEKFSIDWNANLSRKPVRDLVWVIESAIYEIAAEQFKEQEE